MSKSRIGWIDDAKGLAALLVIIGHIANSHLKANTFPTYQSLMEGVHSFIYMFHMPLFMLLSGFVFYKAYCANREIKRRNYFLQLANLAWLYIFFAIALWCAKMLFSAHVVANVSLRDLIYLAVDPIDETWYLYVLFFIYIVCYMVERIKASEEIKLASLLLISFVADFLPISTGLPLYRILHYTFFFYCGVYIAKKPEGFLTKSYSHLIYYIGSAIVTVLFFVIGDIARIEIVNVVVAFFLSMAVVCLFMRQKSDKKGICAIVQKALNVTGVYALEVYLLHTYVITVCRVILPKVGIVQFVPNMLVSFLLCVLVPIWAVIILKKIKLHTFIFRPVALLKK